MIRRLTSPKQSERRLRFPRALNQLVWPTVVRHFLEYSNTFYPAALTILLLGELPSESGPELANFTSHTGHYPKLIQSPVSPQGRHCRRNGHSVGNAAYLQLRWKELGLDTRYPHPNNTVCQLWPMLTFDIVRSRTWNALKPIRTTTKLSINFNVQWNISSNSQWYFSAHS